MRFASTTITVSAATEPNQLVRRPLMASICVAAADPHASAAFPLRARGLVRDAGVAIRVLGLTEEIRASRPVKRGGASVEGLPHRTNSVTSARLPIVPASGLGRRCEAQRKHCRESYLCLAQHCFPCRKCPSAEQIEQGAGLFPSRSLNSGQPADKGGTGQGARFRAETARHLVRRRASLKARFPGETRLWLSAPSSVWSAARQLVHEIPDVICGSRPTARRTGTRNKFPTRSIR